MSGESTSKKISDSLKSIGLAGLLAVSGGLVSKIWDALPPWVVSLLVTLGLMFVLAFPVWRLVDAHLLREIESARETVATEVEKDAGEQAVRERLVGWLMGALGAAVAIGLALAFWVCGILNVPTPAELLYQAFN